MRTPRPAGRRAVLAAALLLATQIPMPARAHAPEPHHIQVQADPYPVEVGFSEWPLVAERSVDITFTPADGIAGKTATIIVTGPHGTDFEESGTLGRHPRQRDRWGLDLIALPAEGDWTFTLAIDGPRGPGTATVGPIAVGPRPGPPAPLAYLVGVLPLFAVAALIVVGWCRVRPGRTAEAATWT